MEKQFNVEYTIYRPQGKPSLLVQIAHGMAEHRKRYEPFCRYLQEKGYAVIIHDHRGHGESAASEAEFGFFAEEGGWLKAVEDIHELSQHIKEEYPEVPLVLFGHSMGSLLSRSYCKRYDSELAGLILSGAPCYNKMAPLGIKAAKLVGKLKGSHYRSEFLDKLATGSFNKQFASPRTKFDWVSANSDNVDEYLNDPYCGFVFTAKGFEDMMWGMSDMHEIMDWSLRNPSLPILFVSGKDDPVTGGAEGIMSSVNKLHEAGYDDIESRVYPGFRHEILNEVQKDVVYDEINAWIERKVLKD